MIAFGVIGYIMRKAGFESPPLVLAFILGPRMEQSLRQSLLLSQGSVGIFFERPIALGCLILAAVLIIISFSRYTAQKREEMLQEGLCGDNRHWIHYRISPNPSLPKRGKDNDSPFGKGGYRGI